MVPNLDSVAELSCDPAQSLDVHEAGVEFREGVAIHDVNYGSVASGRVEAFLEIPPDDGKFPGLISD